MQARRHGKKGSRKKKVENKGLKKSTGNGTNGNKYEIVPGEGLVSVKDGEGDEDEEDEIRPEIGFIVNPTSMEDPLCYWMHNEGKFAINTIHDGWKMFENP